jgi:5-methylcytosine-specific restriction endonuclease McrA
MKVSDRRYGSLRWKKLRLAVLNRDNYECQIRGPRCRGAATSVHHVIPSSEAPHLFFDAGNLQASCSTCNSSAGAYLTRDSRRAIIEQNRYLERVVKAQEERIIELEDQLARHLNGPEAEQARTRAKPAIR